MHIMKYNWTTEHNLCIAFCFERLHIHLYVIRVEHRVGVRSELCMYMYNKR